MNKSDSLCDFSATGAVDEWNVVTDNVMGGLSEGSIASNSEGYVVFSGSVSLENNGGFASIRYIGKLESLTGCSGFRLSVQGDGKNYQFRAHTESAEKGHAYKHDFATASGEWLDIDLPLEKFILSKHGQLAPEAGKITPVDIHQISFLIAGGQAGEFALKVRHIKAYC
jgi:NADH dehydrogenase [ubiquinone] 1 alpha subcomplex assembly factor 1